MFERFNQIKEAVLVDSSEYMLNLASTLIQECDRANKREPLSLTSYPSLLSVIEQVFTTVEFHLEGKELRFCSDGSFSLRTSFE